MKKVFGIAALLLVFVACNKIETEITPAGQSSAEGITITATLAPKTTDTKAVADKGDNKITVTWAVNEHMAILYEVSGTKYVADATIKSVDGNGSATIEFTVQSGTPDNTPCTLVYPLTAAKDDHTGVKDAATLLAAQDGTLNADLDVRVGAGTIQTTTPGLSVTTQPEAQFAIVKFTLQNTDGNPISAKSLAATIGNDAFVATPGSAASEFYLALPAVSGGTLIFSVPGNEGTSSYRSSKTILTIEAGKYYRSTVQMEAQSDNADYVPMGDGRKWALKNVGASSPADYGDYFAWGETEPYYSSQSPLTWKDGKSGYNWANYGFTTEGGSTFTKYTGSDHTVLQAADDAATQSTDWGSSWRMPTVAEWNALLETSDYTWAWVENFNNTGTNGRLVISRKSGVMGNCIFLPAAGYRDDASLYNTGSCGFYWSSSLNSGGPHFAYILSFDPGYAGWDFDHRCFGQSVRPVSD